MSSTLLRKAAVSGAAVVAVLLGPAAVASAQAPADAARGVTAAGGDAGWYYCHPGQYHVGPGWGHRCDGRWHGDRWHGDRWHGDRWHGDRWHGGVWHGGPRGGWYGHDHFHRFHHRHGFGPWW